MGPDPLQHRPIYFVVNTSKPATAEESVHARKMKRLQLFKSLPLLPGLLLLALVSNYAQETAVFQIFNMTSLNALKIKNMTSRSKIRCLRECQIVGESCVSLKYNVSSRQCTLFSTLNVSPVQTDEAAYVKTSHFVVTQVGKCMSSGCNMFKIMVKYGKIKKKNPCIVLIGWHRL